MAATLESATASLRDATDLLASATAILDSGTQDLPRLATVLQQTRHFGLVPSSTLTAAQQDVLAEIGPEIDSLVSRVERQVERLERREQSLRAQWELNEGRLNRSEQQQQAKAMTTKGEQAASSKLDPMQELKAKQLRQKKERLSYAVERLTLQASQTQRKLRMSVAAQERRVPGDE